MTSSNSIKHIIAASDLSDHSSNAVKVAAALAKNHKAKLSLVHAIEALPLVSAWGDPGGVSWIGLPALIETARSALQKIADQMNQQFGIKPEVEVLVGSAHQQISQAAKKSAADLVVIGTHGHRRLVERLLGTTAQNVVRRCEQPVLIVRRDAQLAWHHIVAATDFSESAMAAASLARSLAPDVALTLLHVDPAIPEATLALARPDAAQLALYVEHQQKKSKQALKDQCNKLGENVTPLQLDGEPTTQLKNTLEQTGADLLALGTHGRTLLEAGLLGSFSQKALFLGDCDVLVVRK